MSGSEATGPQDLSAELRCPCQEEVVGILRGDPEPGLAVEEHPGSVPSVQFLWSWVGPHTPTGSTLLSRWTGQQGHTQKVCWRVRQRKPMTLQT